MSSTGTFREKFVFDLKSAEYTDICVILYDEEAFMMKVVLCGINEELIQNIHLLFEIESHKPTSDCAHYKNLNDPRREI